jgi:predicted metal-dependent enzyme (double-stranded beta helix superfamily)
VQSERYVLQEFVQDVDRVIRGYSSESEILLHLKPVLEKLVSSPESVPAKAFTPRKDRFAMNLLKMPEDEAYSIIGGVWHPGQNYPDSRPSHLGLDRSLRGRGKGGALP